MDVDWKKTRGVDEKNEKKKTFSWSSTNFKLISLKQEIGYILAFCSCMKGVDETIDINEMIDVDETYSKVSTKTGVMGKYIVEDIFIGKERGTVKHKTECKEGKGRMRKFNS